MTQPTRCTWRGGTASTRPPFSTRQLGTTPMQLYEAVGRSPQRVLTPVPEALETSAANCRTEQEARGRKRLAWMRSKTLSHRMPWPRGAAAGSKQDEAQRGKVNHHLCEGRVA